MLLHKLTQGYAAIAIFLAIASVFFFWDPLFTWPSDKVLAGGDVSLAFAPWLNFVFDSLRQYGVLPLWDSYRFAGVPHYVNPEVMMFYPFTYLGMLMPLNRAMALTLAIHIWLAGVGMYGWLRSLGASHGGAFLAGTAFAFTGTFAVRVGAGHYTPALQLAWWPLAAWALQIALSRRSWRWAIVSGLPLAMGLLSGHVVTCWLLYLTLGLYAFVAAMMACKQDGGWIAGAHVLSLAAVAVGMSLALAAVQLVPLLNFSRLSARAADPSLEFSGRFSMPISHLITLLVPNFFGEIFYTGYWSAPGYEEFTYYIGVLIVLVAAVGALLIRQSTRHLPFFLMLAVSAVILQLGPDGVLFLFFYRFVPGVALTRAPGRAGIIYAFAAVTAAGLVWSKLESVPQETVRRLLGVFSSRLVWVVSTLVVSAALLALILYAAIKSDETGRLWHLAGQLVRFLVLFWTVMGLFAAWRNGLLSQRAINALAVGILIFDLWSYGLKNVRPRDNPLMPIWSRIATFMRDKPYRIAPEDFEIGELNGALAFRVRTNYGYDSIVLERYQALLDSATGVFDRVYDLLNIRYIVTHRAIDFGDGPRLNVSVSQENLWIYRRPNPLPRAFIVHEAQVIADDAAARAALHATDFVISRTVTLPAPPPCTLEPLMLPVTETAQIVSESPNHLELTTRSKAAGLLVLSEVEYPGWQAWVDGQPTPVLRADTVLRAVCLPAGEHTVRFEFRPRDLAIGAIISCAALLVMVAAAASLARPEKPAKAAPMPPEVGCGGPTR